MSSPHYKGSSRQLNPLVSKPGDPITIDPLRLDITWGGDPRYWRIDETKKIAELIQVSWLEVNGSLDLGSLQAGAKYKLEFHVHLKPDAFGWNDAPVYLMVKPGKQSKYIWKNADLTRLPVNTTTAIPFPSTLEFTVPLGIADQDDKLTFGLFEIWKGRWKGGLVIKDVVISKV